MTRLLPSLLVSLTRFGTVLRAQSLTITNATVTDVSSGALHRGTTIVVDGNRITRVGPVSSAGSARGRVVDAKGMYVIPGLWDMHAHAYFGWAREK